MNKLPMSTTAISVLAAVILWYLATVLEDDGRWLEPAPKTEATTSFGRQIDESPLYGGAAALRCQEAERQMQTLVDESRMCESDSDCTIFDYGYPIQCLTSVANSSITALRVKYRDYESKCEFRVYYDCPAEPLERHPVCRNNRCEVELRTLDYLRDETLQHLGIEDVK
ncbi:hypothetical protein [Woeseia oceani]|uniref:Uncharacterized protein n=1 Tax=Woeseia oceani TaxID=1548547 RepID=A0A193LHE6_9GAMM|nr:hypothetical protein [Woeseia oceani]ANO51804.1 hypothetical protein BA177_11860 [Woeseia oceani]